MATWLAIVVCALFSGRDDVIGRTIRSSDDQFLAMMASGWARSSTFRDVAGAIADLHGIVYVERGRCGPRGRELAACLVHAVVTTPDGTRILRVVAGDASRDRWIALVGHELRHAQEALESPAVVDGQSMTRRFEVLDPGWAASTLGVFETRKAQLTEARIRTELADRRE